MRHRTPARLLTIEVLDCCTLDVSDGYQGRDSDPIMIIVTLMTMNTKKTGSVRFPRSQWILGWISTAIMLTGAGGTLADFLIQ